MLTVSLLVGMLAVWWYTSHLQTKLVKSLALENARAYTHMLKEFRTLYTSEVVSRVKSAGIEVAQDYEKRAKALPSPFTLTMKLGAAIGQRSAIQTYLYSTDPSAEQQRTNSPSDPFAKEAWDSLAKNPDPEVFRFAKVQGRPTLRYATAWKEGDTRGVLEVIQPLHTITAQTGRGRVETFGLLGGLGALGFVMLVVIAGKVRRNVEESEQHALALESEISKRERAQHAFQSEIAERKHAEQELLDAVNVLAAATSDILEATSQLASSATEMAAAVSETTATVEQVKQTAALSSQKAQQVSANAQKAAQISQTGKKATADTIGEMHRVRDQMQAIADGIVKLSEQSQVIREIIDVVNDLAEQSNLLAVNASIEAQKAGAHGSGFAVVAQEVRSLAQQSKEATAQVQAILNDIERATSTAVQITAQGAKAADVGMKQSIEAGAAIGTLAQSVEEAAQSATLIATSNQQQAIGMDQLAQAMLNIQQGSAQTVTSTKQVEASAQRLHELGQKLKSLSGQLASTNGVQPVSEGTMAAAA
jgi:methyl-accepting chemotaxis protein